MDTVLDEELDIRVPAKEPEELSHNSFPVDTFGREERESVIEVESELSSKETVGDITTSEILIVDTVLDKFSTKIEVLLFWVE